jgi:hypothetical protein
MIRGQDLLPIVEILASVDTEASLRTRIGRLYYATFLEVRRWCDINRGYSRVRMAREHQALSNLLAAIDPTLPGDMRLLREARNAADYDEFLALADIQDYLDRARSLASGILARLDTTQP